MFQFWLPIQLEILKNTNAFDLSKAEFTEVHFQYPKIKKGRHDIWNRDIPFD